MANSPSSGSGSSGNSPADAVRKAADSPAAHDARDDMAALRNDLGRLSETVASLIGDQAGQVRDKATDKAGELYATGRDALRSVEAQARSAADDLSRKVVDNPLSSIGIAFGLGYIYAMMRRGR
jgi:ElaB/YqjD/DUF883 family membrane-anchored ribosome-binding protein